MLYESRDHRRRERDDADAQHLRWTEYERRKRAIADEAMDAMDYHMRVMQLAKEMGI